MSYSEYGSPAKISEVRLLIDHTIAVNRIAGAAPKRKTPLCIWGSPGIGKTELVESYAIEKGFQIINIAPAQFEEMGDLLGMPMLREDRMHLAPPEWIPNQEGPGILLIDDVNRADDRILRGLMQLFQHYKMVSWELPHDWHIILTANPDTGDFSVTPMDEAMLSRLRHVRLQFDLSEWLMWAEGAGLDARGLEFIQCYPEIFQSERINPRSFTHFLESIQPISDLKTELELVRLLAEASLDVSTSAAFLHFVTQEMGQLPSTYNILNSSHFQQEIALPLSNIIKGEVLRMDILSLVGDRLIVHIQELKSPLTISQKENLKALAKHGMVTQ